MLTIEQIRERIAGGYYEFSRHAFRRVVERNISDTEIRQASAMAQLIEDYPHDKYSPSCLLLGFTLMGRPLHMQVSRAEMPVVKIITLYEPENRDWLQGYKVRRK